MELNVVEKPTLSSGIGSPYSKVGAVRPASERRPTTRPSSGNAFQEDKGVFKVHIDEVVSHNMNTEVATHTASIMNPILQRSGQRSASRGVPYQRRTFSAAATMLMKKDCPPLTGQQQQEDHDLDTVIATTAYGGGLVQALRQRVLDVTRERDRLAAELEAVKRQTRVTYVAELESQVKALYEELYRQAEIKAAMAHRMEMMQVRVLEAEQRSITTMDTIKSIVKHGLMDKPEDTLGDAYRQHACQAVQAVQTGPTPVTSLSARNTNRTISALRSAHEVISVHATALRKALGCGSGTYSSSSKSRSMTFPKLVAAAESNPSIGGAPDVLRCLLIHLGKIASELCYLPGGKEALNVPHLYPASSATLKEKPEIMERFLFPLPGYLPRQISSTCDLVLGLVDMLMDLRAARLSSPAQRLHPLFLDDMRAISNIALDLKEELQRAEHAFKEAGLRSVSSIVNANNSSRHGGSYSFERANISTSRRAAARKAANLFASSTQDVAHEECRNMDDIKDSVADSGALPLPSITDTSDLPLPSITDTSLPLPSVTDSSHQARGESLEMSQDL